MNSAEKGERYARSFRKAGAFLGKGETARAIEALREGERIALASGDRKMAERFAAEIARLSIAPDPAE
jgi:hypothetical protein